MTTMFGDAVPVGPREWPEWVLLDMVSPDQAARLPQTVVWALVATHEDCPLPRDARSVALALQLTMPADGRPRAVGFRELATILRVGQTKVSRGLKQLRCHLFILTGRIQAAGTSRAQYTLTLPADAPYAHPSDCPGCSHGRSDPASVDNVRLLPPQERPAPTVGATLLPPQERPAPTVGATKESSGVSDPSGVSRTKRGESAARQPWLAATVTGGDDHDRHLEQLHNPDLLGEPLDVALDADDADLRAGAPWTARMPGPWARLLLDEGRRRLSPVEHELDLDDDHPSVLANARAPETVAAVLDKLTGQHDEEAG